MISRIALIAAAGTLLGASLAPAKAADLGGGCCADLEERVAELEATTARKGNRVVSLQIYGTVAKGLLIWDNGEESDAYVVDNDAITSILGFKGEAAMKPGWKAGYKVELGVIDSSSALVDEDDDEGDGGIFIRHSHVYIESERLGRFTIGQQSSASDGAAQVSLANTLIVGAPDHNPAFTPVGAAHTVGQFISDFDGDRLDLIRYDSPSIYGFILSASWGEDDYYDVALRFAKEWNSVRIAAAIAYAESDPDEPSTDFEDFNFDNQLIGSVSVMHVPTGLFIMGAAGQRDYRDGDDAHEGSYWYLQGGIEKNWFGYGKTTLYGEFGDYEDVVVDHEGTNAEMYGFGVVQRFDSAALDLYAQARFYSFEDELQEPDEDFSTLMIGAKIDF